ncbi:carbohydrate porin [Thiocystis violacea]|uniref:carbohydrate porin n=1 Tax=Thiocystis violacea TaxID=13725 RepID=UPI001904F380|nr:carbohydrate porin [Thiocystis violacea]
MRKLIAISLLLSSGIAMAEGAQSASDAWYERKQLTGNWGGVRDSLEDRGISPFLVYDSIIGANVSGGIEAANDFTGQVYAGIKLDLEKLLGLNRTTFKMSMVNRHGDSVGEFVGGIYDPMTIYGGQTTYLYDLWLETTFGDNWALKLGRISADQDFAVSPLYAYSLSTAINGPIRALLLENAMTSFPYAVWGGRLKYRIAEQHHFQIGAYQIGPNMWNYHDHGVDFSIRGDDGVSILAQYDWTPKVLDRPAHVYVGVINSFYDFNDFDEASTTDYFARFYGHADVEVVDGLKLFGLLTYSDQDEVAKTPFQGSVGAIYKGLIPSREDDRTFFYATYGGLSNDYGRSLGEDVDFEAVYELGHRFQIIPSFFIQPSVQYIQKPGGTGNIDDAIVLGAWIGASF